MGLVSFPPTRELSGQGNAANVVDNAQLQSFPKKSRASRRATTTQATTCEYNARHARACRCACCARGVQEVQEGEERRGDARAWPPPFRGTHRADISFRRFRWVLRSDSDLPAERLSLA